jgi:hypothetical protein
MPSPPQNDPPEWTKVSLPLPPKHQWKAKQGYQIFVADAGAVRLEFPQGWTVRNDGKQTIYMHDRPPPDDVARVSLTVFRLPPMGPDWWEQLPLEKMLLDAIREEDESKGRKAAPLPRMKLFRRAGMEVGWLEKPPWTDPENGKPIRCRQLLARGRRTQVLITFDTYEHVGDRFDGAWNHLLNSLRLEAPVNIDGTGRN